ncbi:MAG: M20/M25/M40 family metallo-hydrolase [Oscillospiraceae bacterium]|nr:M20/M25/M40 family metallo-hydrolase [Oscillospiraceae bacterium]
MDIKQTLLELSGAAGYGVDAADILAPYGKVSRTSLDSVVCQVREASPNKPHLLLDAHFDTVGLIVTQVDSTGFLRVSGLGGIDPRVLPACPVLVHGRGGDISGVICSTPPHLDKSGEKKFAKVDEVYIDLGLTKEAAENAVSPGDRVSFHQPGLVLLGDRFAGGGLDNRAGCACLLRALELLKGAQPSCGLSVLFSSLEEVGGQGAKTTAYALRPTHALVVDTSFAHTPDSQRQKCGTFGGGPMIGVAPILSKEITEGLQAAAKAEGIPHQYEVMGGSTGTNADHIATVRAGVSTGLLSIPLKYMHTPVEVVAASDIEQTARLIAVFVKDFAEKAGELV